MNTLRVIWIAFLIMPMSIACEKAHAYDIEVEIADGLTLYFNYINNRQDLEVSGARFLKSYSWGFAIPKEINTPNGQLKVTSIGQNAFYSCKKMNSIVIPNSVIIIKDNAFADCSELNYLAIGDSVTTIGQRAFWGCENLTSVTIPNSVTTIGNYAFYNCKNLNSITIGNAVNNIGEDAFEGTPWLSTKPDGLIYAGSVAYKYKGNMPANTKITIKDGTLVIADYLFKGLMGLTSVTMPNSVRYIGREAFSCTSLTSVTIPDSVHSIGDYAFYGCI